MNEFLNINVFCKIFISNLTEKFSCIKKKKENKRNSSSYNSKY